MNTKIKITSTLRFFLFLQQEGGDEMIQFHPNSTLFISLHPMNQCGSKSADLLPTH